MKAPACSFRTAPGQRIAAKLSRAARARRRPRLAIHRLHTPRAASARTTLLSLAVAPLLVLLPLAFGTTGTVLMALFALAFLASPLARYPHR